MIEAQESMTVITKKGGYRQINGCTQGMSAWQILGLSIVVILEILGFLLIQKIVDLDMTILYILIGVNYFCFVLVIIDYCLLSCSDPSDPRLKNQSYSQPNQETRQCHRCKIRVQLKSYHCLTCERCVQGFDHHCVFLNNCIGKQNYGSFLRFLIELILHMTISIVIGVIVVVEVEDYFQWISVAYISLAGIVLLEITVLAIFHCYISFCLYKTTLEWLRGDRSNQSQTKTVTVPVYAKQSQEVKRSQDKPKEEQTSMNLKGEL